MPRIYLLNGDEHTQIFGTNNHKFLSNITCVQPVQMMMCWENGLLSRCVGVVQFFSM